MKKYVKFKGNFKDLKPLGFKFGKAFARNYKHYKFGDYFESDIYVWVHLGGYLEFGQLFNNSYLILKLLSDPNFRDKIRTEFDITIYNTESEEFEYYEFEKHEYTNYMMRIIQDKYSPASPKEFHEKLNSFSREERREISDALKKKYIEIRIPEESIQMLLKLIEMDVIEIADDYRKS